jgi:hypothetical protein
MTTKTMVRVYKCRGCGAAVKGDVWCNTCLNEQLEEAAELGEYLARDYDATH